MTIVPFKIKARISSRGEAGAYLKEPGDAVIVDRGGPRWLIMSCPCGCGTELPVNLDRRAGAAWRLYETSKGTSVYPSVWRDTDCMSHFIILRNKIWLLGTRDDEVWSDEDEPDTTEFELQVLGQLSRQRAQTAEALSDKIPDSVPWDVVQCCRRLVRRGLVIEGHGSTRGQFWLR